MQTSLGVFGKVLQTLKKLRTKKEKQGELSLYLNGEAGFDDEALSAQQRYLWVLCLDPMHTFGVTNIPAKSHSAAPAIVECPLQDLIHRRLTGNAALAAVRTYYDSLSDDARHGFRAIIQRRPDCGVSAKTVNAVRPGLLSLFQVMLAKEWDEKRVQELMKEGASGALVEPKYDGERRVAINLDGSVGLFSRDGRRDSHFPELNTLLSNILPQNHVFDGELYPLDHDFHRLASMTRSKGVYALTEANIAYIVFDHMPLDAWAEGVHEDVQRVRSATLAELLTLNGAFVRRARSTHVASVQQADDLYLHYLDEGLEGVIVKDPNARYAFKRNAAWIKRKVTATVDLVIESILPGDAGKQFENSLGRIVCRHNGKEVHVAPGKMSHDERQRVWIEWHNFVGFTIEVAFQEETPDGSLRHPRFIRWRDDK